MIGERLTLTHEEFVNQYRAGKVTLSYDVGVAFQLKTRLSRPLELVLMMLSPSGAHVSVLCVLAAYYYSDWWLLFGIPVAWIGMAAASAVQYPGSKALSCLPTLLALAATLYGLKLGWPSVMLVLASAYWVAHEGTLFVYWMAKRVFVRRIHESEEAYNVALGHNHISVHLNP
jgi:hypothetical protein